jgi:hypothetical protein
MNPKPALERVKKIQKLRGETVDASMKISPRAVPPARI